MNLIQKVKKEYKRRKKEYDRGYELAKSIHELVTLYGKDNYLNGNVDDKDKERLFDVKLDLCSKYGSFYMRWGYERYLVKHGKEFLKSLED